MFFKIVINSLLNRKATVLLTMAAVIISIFVVLTVQQLDRQIKHSFTRSVSSVDLIVGGKTGQLNLLLSSIFRIGQPSNAISWQSYQNLKQHKLVNWAVPVVLGDSHKGYSVVATTSDFFKHYKYAQKQALELASGQAFQDSADIAQVVLGAEVAAKLGYQVGDRIILSHGVGRTSFAHHDHIKFEVVGVLQQTATPVDQSVHISVMALDLMHDQHKHQQKHQQHDHDHHEHAHSPEKVTAVLVGLKSKIASLTMQAMINNNNKEPMLAIMPGVALTELWQIMKIVERVLYFISLLVLLASFFSIGAMMLATMQQRKREIAIFRALGAHPRFVFLLIQCEVLFITLSSAVVAAASCYLMTKLLAQYISQHFGLYIEADLFAHSESYQLIAVICVGALVAACIPAIQAYRQALHSRLTES